MINGKILLEKLIAYAKEFLYLDELDVCYEKNLLCHELKLSSPSEEVIDVSEVKSYSVPDVLIKELSDYAMENAISDNEIDAELFANYIFGLLSPKPSQVNETFLSLKEKFNSQTACDYLYALSVKNYYIRKTAIDKNIKWDANDLDIPLEITINLSKPEKNNKDIAKLLTLNSSGNYPMCALCKENEGFYGTLSKPARSNIRTVTLNVNGEKWGMQYSPYLYFDEHCIFFNHKHTPMAISERTVSNLFDIIEFLPNYFVGSNSDLPIVGGSILNHEHYQGGKHLMPLQHAKAKYKFYSEKYDDVEVEIVKFYNSVIRITGFNRKSVQSLAGEIIEKWKTYSDESVDIIASTDGVRHNTVTPIARFLDDKRYCLEIILRNNRTNETYPDGIFHAHPEYHNIKKEGIGLIEAMGLYILPARLKRQLGEIAEILAHKKPYEVDNADLLVHKDMIKYLLSKYPRVKDVKKANQIITEYVNDVCAKILGNTAVFKQDNNGIVAFMMFMNACDLKTK